MSAPGTAGRTSAEKLERELLARLGLDSSATPEDVSSAHEAVAAYLAAAPRGLRSWARTQAAGADEAYALLTDPAALARAVALVGASARSAVLPGESATPPARRDSPAPAPVVAPPAAPGASAAATALAAPARFDEQGRRIISDDEIDALLAEVDPTIHREVVGTAAQRAASSAAASGTPAPSLLTSLLASPAFRNVALVCATVVAIGIVAVLGFGTGGPGTGSIGAGASGAPAASVAPVLDQAKVAELMGKIQANPQDADSLMALGDEFYNVGDFASAAGWFTKVTTIEPTKIRSFLALGAAAFNNGDDATAEAAWKQVVALDDTNVEAHYDLGLLYFTRQPPDMAAIQLHWNRVIELDPTSEIAGIVKAHLGALASAAPAGSPAASGAPAESAAPSAAPSPSPAAAPSASPAPSPSPAPSGSPLP